MIIPLIASALYCSTPQLINKTDTWTEQDQAALLEVQKSSCKEHDAQKPCLEAFQKEEINGEVEYSAQCGPEKRRPR